MVMCKQVLAWTVQVRHAGKLWVGWRAAVAAQKQGTRKSLPTPSEPSSSSPLLPQDESGINPKQVAQVVLQAQETQKQKKEHMASVRGREHRRIS